MAADRGAFICQSQSLNLFIQEPNYAKLTSMHFYGWKKGLKTGMYYLRTKAATDAIKFTVDTVVLEKTEELLKNEVLGNEDQLVIERVVAPVVALSEQEKIDQLSCSLDNPEGCEMCGS